ncbi:energy transducer TonB [Pyxidicoccus fallax]|uniref:Energy transducer TonB n=1 Tax=Pyxidicoccus fallax TaxID=394095 RepID=A0A848LHP9_9BACT|nr:energy transducer TonB [Pyxidicoccus fallax]NMO16258.1 energy transducer TonB [Pyxidicoccus fallax]NPC78671.1 energy transducer TonB [Pyxidicoccus fallax]
MFNSVMERQRAGRLGAGVWLSIGVHAAVFVAVLFISARPPPPAPEPDPFEGRPWVVPMSPAAPQGTPAPAQPKQAVKPRTRRDTAPRQVQALPAEPLPAEPDATSSLTDEQAASSDDGATGHPAGSTDCPPVDGPIGVTDVLMDQLVSSYSQTEELHPFGPGMTPPVMLGGQPIAYTPGALAAGVEGTLVAKCTITVDGQVKDCRVIKGLPHMNEAVLESLHSRRYRPVTYQGRPVSVSYSFTVKLKLPR